MITEHSTGRLQAVQALLDDGMSCTLEQLADVLQAFTRGEHPISDRLLLPSAVSLNTTTPEASYARLKHTL